jgi:hypothetical protein
MEFGIGFEMLYIIDAAGGEVINNPDLIALIQKGFG